MSLFLVSGLAIAVAVIFLIMILNSLIIICPPNRVAVISGRSRQLSDGRTVGYRILKGGRTVRIRFSMRQAELYAFWFAGEDS